MPIPFLGPMAGRPCGNSRGRRSVCQKVSKFTRASSLPEPKSVRSAGTDTDPPNCSHPTPYGPGLLLPPLRTPIVLPLVHPKIAPLLGHRFPAGNGPRAARALSTSASTRGASIPLPSRLPSQWEGHVSPWPASHSGGKPPQSMRWGDFQGTSELAKCLECASLLALSKRHCARRPTAPCLLPTNDRILWGPDDTHHGGASFTPAPGMR